jgi:hypothetical protein
LASYAKDSKNIEVVFKLAQKYDDRLDPYDPPSRDKIVKLIQEVLSLDPDGKKGTTDYGGKKVTSTEYAGFSLGVLDFRGPKRESAGALILVSLRAMSNSLTNHEKRI